MRLVTKAEDLIPLLKQAQQEAEGAFGNGAVYMERAIVGPRHIEFQVRDPLDQARTGPTSLRAHSLGQGVCCRSPTHSATVNGNKFAYLWTVWINLVPLLNNRQTWWGVFVFQVGTWGAFRILLRALLVGHGIERWGNSPIGPGRGPFQHSCIVAGPSQVEAQGSCRKRSKPTVSTG